MSFTLDTPDCYGKSWNPKDVLCAGGADFTFTDENGRHIRPQCDHYSTCGVRTSHSKMEQSRLVPVQNLVRSPTSPMPDAVSVFGPKSNGTPISNWTGQTPAPTMTKAQMEEWMNQKAKEMAMQMWQNAQSYPQARSTATYSSNNYPQNMPFYDPRFQPMPVNFQMPAYLTVPQQREPGESLISLLFKNLFRSMMKAGGHSFAHFWDTVPMGPYLPMPPTGS